MGTVQKVIQKCLDIKSQSISPIATVEVALKKMAEHDSGALLVMDFENLVGIFSERDYARKILLKGKSSLTTPVFEVMTTNLISVSPEYKLTDCLALMSSCQIRHLPVLEDDKVVALLGIEDVAFALIENHEFVIDELTTYITGSYSSSNDFKNEAPKLANFFRSIIQ